MGYPVGTILTKRAIDDPNDVGVNDCRIVLGFDEYVHCYVLVRHDMKIEYIIDDAMGDVFLFVGLTGLEYEFSTAETLRDDLLNTGFGERVHKAFFTELKSINYEVARRIWRQKNASR